MFGYVQLFLFACILSNMLNIAKSLKVPSLLLNNGLSIPQLGLGTYKVVLSIEEL